MSEHEDTVEIDLDDQVDRWKWRCPRGHTSWEPTNNHFWCRKCASAWDVDPEFDELTNDRTGDSYQRDQVELVTEMGDYRALHKGSA